MIEGHDIGGTCVNRGCVPSKALLAAAGRIREMQNEMHMKAMGIQVSQQQPGQGGRPAVPLSKAVRRAAIRLPACRISTVMQCEDGIARPTAGYNTSL